jgi:hypothetical protein
MSLDGVGDLSGLGMGPFMCFAFLIITSLVWIWIVTIKTPVLMQAMMTSGGTFFSGLVGQSAALLAGGALNAASSPAMMGAGRQMPSVAAANAPLLMSGAIGAGGAALGAVGKMSMMGGQNKMRPDQYEEYLKNNGDGIAEAAGRPRES